MVVSREQVAERIRRHGRAASAPATASDLARATRLLGPLAEELEWYLRTVGWCEVDGSEILGLGMGLDSDVPKHLDIVETVRVERSPLGMIPSHLLPVYHDGGGNFWSSPALTDI